MKWVFLFFCALLVLVGCASITVSPVESGKYLGYVPIEPVPSPKVKIYDAQSNTEKEVYWETINNPETKRTLLPIQSAHVAVTKSDASGKTTYLTASVSGEAGTYKVVMDYMKYRVEDVYDSTGDLLGSGRIGIGLRINAELVTSKKNVNLNGIMAIGAEAQQGNLRGGISVDVIGIDSKDVTNLIPLTATIDQSSIQAALQALASIKSKLWDTTVVTPHLVALLPTQPDKQGDIKKSLSQNQIDILIKRSNFTKLGDEAIQGSGKAFDQLLNIVYSSQQSELIMMAESEATRVKSTYIYLNRLDEKERLSYAAPDGTVKIDNDISTSNLIDILIGRIGGLNNDTADAWKDRALAARYLAQRNEKAVPQTLFESACNDQSLDVRKIAIESFSEVTNYQIRDVLECKYVQQWWMDHKIEIEKKLK